MTTALLTDPRLLGLGLAVLHAAWEGALLGLLAWTGLLLLRRRSAQVRYRFAFGCLGAMVALPVLTALQARGALGLSGGLVPASAPAWGFTLSGVEAVAGLPPALRAAVPWVAIAWLLGAIAMGLRLGGGLWWLERAYVKPSRPAPEALGRSVRALALRMGVAPGIRLRVTDRGESPLVIGWLRPLVLVPAGALLHLAPEALEAVLAHELAHVQRSDYLANLLQSCAEALLFFHPAVWWLSGQIRELREHCCDDLAAAACGDPLALAEGLSALEHLRRTLPTASVPAPGFALGASKGNLMPRILRLFQPQDAAVPSLGGLALLLGSALLIGSGALAAQNAVQKAPKAEAVATVPFSRVRVVNQPDAPDYPPEAKARRIQGTVVVAVTVDPQGVPEKVEGVSGPRELWPTAIGYAKSWTFAPVKVKGKAVKAQFPLTMPFRLREPATSPRP